MSVLDKSDSAKFSESAVSNPAVDFQSEGGWALTRARTTRRPRRTFSLGFTEVDNTTKEAIEALWNDRMGGSEIISDWTHPVSQTIVPVRFSRTTQPSYSYRGAGGVHSWDISNVILEEV